MSKNDQQMGVLGGERDLPLNKKRVVVAMSGGVDSSVAAYLLQKEGYDVVGISMKTHDDLSRGDRPVAPTDTLLPTIKHASKNCCSVEDIQDARRVCDQLDIPFYAMNFKDEFKTHVMDYFAKEYFEGRTPNPCVKCNDKLKFKALLRETRALGIDYLATGHYIRKVQNAEGRSSLHRAVDQHKDQSYFLFGLEQDELDHLLFPLGDLTKGEVRAIAKKIGMRCADKPESQEICFVPNNDYAAVIEKLYPDFVGTAGEFKRSNGKVLGKHRGTHAYTVGQRRGLHVATGERTYVKSIDAKNNEVILGSDDELYSTKVIAKKPHWISGNAVSTNTEVSAKLRYRHEPSPAFVRTLDDNLIEVAFKTPQRAIAPGQAVVFYQDDELLGGAWIEKGIA